MSKDRNKEEKEVHKSLLPFARFMSASDYNTLYEGFIGNKTYVCVCIYILCLPLEEVNLKKDIAKLQEYRKRGIRTIEGAIIYEQKNQSMSQLEAVMHHI